MPAFGDVGLRLQHYLFQPLFTLDGLPITFFFSQSRYLYYVVLVLASHFTMLLLQKRVLTSYAPWKRATICRRKSDLVFSVCSRLVGLQYSEGKK